MDLVSHEQIARHGVMRKPQSIQTSLSDRPPAESDQLGLDPNVPLPGQGNTPDIELITDWNQTAADYPRDKRIHDFIEEQVTRSPDAVAAIFRDQQITYRELDSR